MVEELTNCSDYVFRLSGFFDLFSQVFLITLQEQCKSNSLINLLIIERLKRLFKTIALSKGNAQFVQNTNFGL